jgi:hypothetical protein
VKLNSTYFSDFATNRELTSNPARLNVRASRRRSLPGSTPRVSFLWALDCSRSRSVRSPAIFMNTRTLPMATTTRATSDIRRVSSSASELQDRCLWGSPQSAYLPPCAPELNQEYCQATAKEVGLPVYPPEEFLIQETNLEGRDQGGHVFPCHDRQLANPARFVESTSTTKPDDKRGIVEEKVKGANRAGCEAIERQKDLGRGV